MLDEFAVGRAITLNEKTHLINATLYKFANGETKVGLVLPSGCPRDVSVAAKLGNGWSVIGHVVGRKLHGGDTLMIDWNRDAGDHNSKP